MDEVNCLISSDSDGRSDVETIPRKRFRRYANMEIMAYSSLIPEASRDLRLLQLERLMFAWIGDLKHKRMPINKFSIHRIALKVYNDLQILEEDENPRNSISFRKGWFHRLKLELGLYNLRLLGQPELADKEAAANYPDILAAIIEQGNYKAEQIFNVDEVTLLWKTLPSNAYIKNGWRANRRIQNLANYRGEQLTVLLGGNAAGFKIKPLVACPVYQKPVKKIYKADLVMSTNALSWITKAAFQCWFEHYFRPTVDRYLRDKGLDPKILLILDNSPNHSTNFLSFDDKVQVVFIPPNTAPLLQPVDQGILTTFKGYYLHETLSKMLTERDEKNGETLKEYWTKFDVGLALRNITEAWKEITVKEMRSAWKHILPQTVGNLDTLDLNKNLKKIAKSIVQLGHQLKFTDKFDKNNVLEFIMSNDIELDSRDLMAIRRFHDKIVRFNLCIPVILKILTLGSCNWTRANAVAYLEYR